MASASTPAVVNTSSARIVRAPRSGPSSPFFFDPFFREFFGDEGSRQSNIPRERREQSLGPGVIVSPKGYLLNLAPRQILHNEVPPPDSAKSLLDTLTKYSSRAPA